MTRYSAVPTSPASFDDEEKTVDATSQGLTEWDKILLRLTCFCAVLSTLISLAVVLTRPPPANRVTNSLKRPNPYPGLQNVFTGYSHESFEPIKSLSQLLLQIKVDDPSRRMREDASRQHDTEHGTLFPDDRHFIASRKTSTIVQLKVLDYGMERCVLHVALPNKTDELDPAIQLHPSSIVDIWRLDQDIEISPYNPDTWTYAPKRRLHFASFDLSSSRSWASEEFRCHALTFTIWEFACSPNSSNCDLEFWQDRMSPNGVYLEQRDSISRPPA